MKEKICRLSNNCLSLVDKKGWYHKDLYQEVVNLIMNSNLEDEKKLKLLVELYRYAFYNGVRNSLNPRGDIDFKTRFLLDIKNGLENHQVDDELIEKSQQMNQMFQIYIDHPIEFIDREIKFYRQYPNTRF